MRSATILHENSERETYVLRAKCSTIEYKQTTRKWGTKWGTYQLNFVDNSEAKS